MTEIKPDAVAGVGSESGTDKKINQALTGLAILQEVIGEIDMDENGWFVKLADLTERLELSEHQVLQAVGNEAREVLDRNRQVFAHSVKRPINWINMTTEAIGDNLGEFVSLLKFLMPDYLMFLKSALTGKKEVEKLRFPEEFLEVVEKSWKVLNPGDMVMDRLSFEIAEDVEGEIEVNGFDVKNIVLNLIENTKDHNVIYKNGSPVGENPDLQMEWKMEIVEGRVVVRAVDNGLGFSRHMLEKIDGVSTALLEGESTRKAGGGLGLFQINEIVKLMGGELQIGNRRDFDMEGRGAVVEMSWPIDKSE